METRASDSLYDVSESMPIWSMSGFGNNIMQTWVIGADYEVKAIIYGEINDDVIEEIKKGNFSDFDEELVNYKDFSNVNNKTSKLISELIGAGKEIVLLNVSADRKLFDNYGKVDDVCPPCSNNYELINGLSSQRIGIINVKLTM